MWFVRHPVRCKAQTQLGRRCRNSTRHPWGLCRQHRLVRRAEQARASSHTRSAILSRDDIEQTQSEDGGELQDPITGRSQRQMTAMEIAVFVMSFLGRMAEGSGRPSEGGFTQPPGIDERTGLPLPPPSDGIAVALNGSRLDVKLRMSRSVTGALDSAGAGEHLKDWAEDMDPVFATGAAFMGGWYRQGEEAIQAEGSLEVNVTLVFLPDRQREAEEFAAQEHQIAAFDLAAGSQIHIGGSGETGWSEAREADKSNQRRHRRQDPAHNGPWWRRWFWSNRY